MWARLTYFVELEGRCHNKNTTEDKLLKCKATSNESDRRVFLCLVDCYENNLLQIPDGGS